MKTKVSEQGILIPKKYLEGINEVDIRVEHGIVMVIPIDNDPIKNLGSQPVTVDVSDASEQHDKYIYNQ